VTRVSTIGNQFHREFSCGKYGIGNRFVVENVQDVIPTFLQHFCYIPDFAEAELALWLKGIYMNSIIAEYICIRALRIRHDINIYTRLL
jgi:hypothetical protein